jgi:hypothetical protein
MWIDNSNNVCLQSQGHINKMAWNLMTTTSSLAESRRKRDYKEAIQLHVVKSLPSDTALRNLIGCLFQDIATLSPDALNFRSELLRRLAAEVSMARRRAMNRFKEDICKKAANVLQIRKANRTNEPFPENILAAWAFECMPANARTHAQIGAATSIPQTMLSLVRDILTQAEKGDPVVDEGDNADIDADVDNNELLSTRSRKRGLQQASFVERDEDGSLSRGQDSDNRTQFEENDSCDEHSEVAIIPQSNDSQDSQATQTTKPREMCHRCCCCCSEQKK